MKKINESHGIWRITPSMTLTEIIAQSDFDFQILDFHFQNLIFDF